MVAGDGHRLAVLEHRGGRADLANRVDQTAQHLERGLAAAEDERGRVDGAHGAGDALGREVEAQQQGAEAGAADGQLQGLHVQRLVVEPLGRVEQDHALGAGGGRHDAAGGVQPAGGPAAGQLPLGLARLAALGHLDGGQQDLLDRAVHRPDGQALLHHAVGGHLVEVVEGIQQPAGRAGALAALARDLDGGGDVVGLEKGAAQRLQLDELVLAVATGGAAGLGIAEAALPAAQRVGADPEQLCRSVGPDPAHLVS